MAQALRLERPTPRVSAAETAPPATETTTFAVENMHCGGCMRKVEEAALRVPGVVSARPTSPRGA